MSWRQWLALLMLFIIYLLVGGVVFMQIESPEEELRLKELMDLKQVIYDKLISCKVNETDISNNEREDIWIQIAEQINQPGLVNNQSEIPKKWTLYNSFFVAVTVASTIGYGHLAPSTTAGRLFCIVFALIGIPLNGILFATLGEYFASKFFLRSKKRSSQRLPLVQMLLADIALYLVPGLVIFLAIPAGIFTVVEGWNYIDSFYYAFITLSTIGFGDFVAGPSVNIGNWTWVYRIFIILWIIFGLGYLVMLINIITKGFRSKPIIVLEQKMSSRIRATRKSLAQDALALRELVNEIKILKVKPLSRGERNESTAYENENWQTKDSSVCVIDKKHTLDSLPIQSEYEKEDPVELLIRLASTLCIDAIEDDPDNCPTDGKEVESLAITIEKSDPHAHTENVLDRIRRSFRHSLRSISTSKKLPAIFALSKVSPQFKSQEILNAPPNKRIRHASESISQDQKSLDTHDRRQLKLEIGSMNPNQLEKGVKRSQSEDKSSCERGIQVESPFAFKEAQISASNVDVSKSTESSAVVENLNSLCEYQIKDTKLHENTIEFCGLLERIVISRQNSLNGESHSTPNSGNTEM